MTHLRLHYNRWQITSWHYKGKVESCVRKILPPDWAPRALTCHLTFGCQQQRRGRSIWGWAFCGASISSRLGSRGNTKLMRGLSSSCQVSGTAVWDIVGHRRLALLWITAGCSSHVEIPLQSDQLVGRECRCDPANSSDNKPVVFKLSRRPRSIRHK